MSDDGWDSLEDDARDAKIKPGPVCSVWAMIEDIGKAHGQEAVTSIMRALNNHRLTASSIRAALAKRVAAEMLPSAWSLRNHRGGRCTCGEEED